MFKEKDLNFKETFNLTKDMIKSNSKSLLKIFGGYMLILFVIFAIIMYAVYDVTNGSFNDTQITGAFMVIMGWYMVGFAVIVVVVGIISVYIGRLFYGYLYGINYTHKEIMAFVKKRCLLYLVVVWAITMAVGIAVYIIMIVLSMAFALIFGLSGVIISPMMWSNLGETAQSGQSWLVAIFGFVFIIALFLLMVIVQLAAFGVSSFYRYEVSVNPDSDMGTRFPLKVLKNKPKEFFKLILWQSCMYLLFITGMMIMVFAIVTISEALNYAPDDTVTLIMITVCSIISTLLIMLFMIFYDAFGFVKYYNMKNMMNKQLNPTQAVIETSEVDSVVDNVEMEEIEEIKEMEEIEEIKEMEEIEQGEDVSQDNDNEK